MLTVVHCTNSLFHCYWSSAFITLKLSIRFRNIELSSLIIHVVILGKMQISP